MKTSLLFISIIIILVHVFFSCIRMTGLGLESCGYTDIMSCVIFYFQKVLKKSDPPFNE